MTARAIFFASEICDESDAKRSARGRWRSTGQYAGVRGDKGSMPTMPEALGCQSRMIFPTLKNRLNNVTKPMVAWKRRHLRHGFVLLIGEHHGKG
jgi:hypothetical protein